MKGKSSGGIEAKWWDDNIIELTEMNFASPAPTLGQLKKGQDRKDCCAAIRGAPTTLQGYGIE